MTTSSTFRRSSNSTARVGRLHVRLSTRSHGDFRRTAVPLDELEQRRRAFVDLPWTMLDQRHGTDTVWVTVPGAGDGSVGDIAITDQIGAVLGCWTGDCAPLVLVGADRQFAVVHAGWRGLASGVVDVAIAAFDEPVTGACLGPVIEQCCYEFGATELALVASGVHERPSDITGRTESGRPALDVPAAVSAACARHGLVVERIAGCTGCTYDGYSHRIRRDPERHVLAVWQNEEAS